MDLLKKLFPVSFAEKKDVGSLIVSVIIQVVAGIITAFVFGLLGRVPLIGILFDLLGAGINLALFAFYYVYACRVAKGK